MAFYLLVDLQREVLVEATGWRNARDIGKAFGLGGDGHMFMVAPVSGCEARRYIEMGREHTTSLVVRADGTAGRSPRT